MGLITLAGGLALSSAAAAAPTGSGAGGPLLAGPDLSARSSPNLAGATTSGAISRSQLHRKLKQLAKKAPPSSGFYVYDTDAAGNKVLFDRKEGKRRKLASNTKLFTTATALHRLGPESRIETLVRARGSITPGGRLKGDLYLVGGGDPTLGSSGIKSLAKQVKRAGIKQVKGSVRADDSIFDSKRGVPDSGFGPSPYIAPLSGLVYGGSSYSTDPALEAGSAFKQQLRKRGVKVGGRVKIAKAPKKLKAVSRSPASSHRPSPRSSRQPTSRRTTSTPRCC